MSMVSPSAPSNRFSKINVVYIKNPRLKIQYGKNSFLIIAYLTRGHFISTIDLTDELSNNSMFLVSDNTSINLSAIELLYFCRCGKSTILIVNGSSSTSLLNNLFSMF